MIIDFHTHTHHSPDSLMKAPRILSLAKKRGLSGLVVNDHNTIRGGLEVQAVNRDAAFLVLVGAEIATDAGDVTGIFLQEEVKSRRFADVVAEIKAQGGLVVLNHPFKAHNLDLVDYDAIDLIEGFNGRCDAVTNARAVSLAREKGKPIVAGSDAHLYSEIGNCRTFYDTDDLLRPVHAEYRRSRIHCELTSQLIKAGKEGDVKRFLQLLIWTPKYFRRKLARPVS